MTAAIAKALEFLLEHLDVVVVLVEALEGGASRESIKAAIRAEMIKASDDQMRRELGG